MSAAADLVPGRETDALVAERVMGWTYHPDLCLRWRQPDGFHAVGPPRFSTNIADALRVVEKVGGPANLYLHADGRWTARVGTWSIPRRREGEKVGTADTAPMAICLAVLAAMEAAGS